MPIHRVLLLAGMALSAVLPSAMANTTSGDTSASLAVVTGQASASDLLSLTASSTTQTPSSQQIPSTFATVKLGSDFLWGLATSGFQSEGHAPDSNWRRYIAANAKYDAYGNSVDFFNRYAEDLDRAAAFGVKVFRIGIEWARVEPQAGVIDPAALAFYDAVIKGIVERGMRPMLTIDHWVYPGWMADKGGWASPDMEANWLTNAKRLVDRYAGYSPIWITINEPTIYMQMETSHGGLKSEDSSRMADGLVSVHRAIYDYIHLKQPGALVSSNVAYFSGFNAQVDETIFNRIADKVDFIGIDYYYGLSVTDFSVFGILLGTKQLWEVNLQPEGIYYAMRHYAERHPKLPIFIVETGMPTMDGVRPDGRKRSDVLRDTIYWVQRAKADGIKVMGLNYWSLTDNYEWGSYTARFGLYTVNVKTDASLARVPTDAVPVFAEIVKAQGVPAGYKPVIPTQFCSLVDPPSSCTRPVWVK